VHEQMTFHSWKSALLYPKTKRLTHQMLSEQFFNSLENIDIDSGKQKLIWRDRQTHTNKVRLSLKKKVSVVPLNY